jgi:hypothetical protein
MVGTASGSRGVRNEHFCPRVGLRVNRAFVLATVAACSRPAPSAPAAAHCGPPGIEIYGADLDPIADDERAAIEIRIYQSGAWTREMIEPYRLDHGCLTAADLDRVTRALDRATWMHVVSPGARCAGKTPSAIYFTNGLKAGELSSCEATFDEATWAALHDIEAVVKHAP